MTTTKEFKSLHNLSDSAFKRLSAKIRESYPDQELTRRVGATDWKIVDLALFEQYLSYQTDDRSTGRTDDRSVIPTIEAIYCELVSFEGTASSDVSASSLTTQRNDAQAITQNATAISDILAVASQLTQGIKTYRENLTLINNETSEQAEKLRDIELQLKAELEVTREVEATEKARKAHLQSQVSTRSSNVVNFSERLKKRLG